MSGTTNDPFLRVFDPDPDRAADKYRVLFRRLKKYFQARTRASVAEDLAQETVRRALSRIRAGVEVYVEPAAYFFRIAENVAIENWRKPTRPESALPAGDLPDVKNVDFRDAEVRICLEQVLRLLPRDERELLLRYQREDHEQLARELGLDEGHLRVKVYRAKERLQQLVRRAVKGVQPGETVPPIGSYKE